jgi:hypothetical protein
VEWGWAANEALDAAPDPSKPPGTPGRYRNFVTLDPTDLIPPESRAKPDGRLGTSYGPQEKSFNPIISTSASMRSNRAVGDAAGTGADRTGTRRRCAGGSR